MTEIQRHYFKEGDEVAHKENLTQMMEVRRLIKKKVKHGDDPKAEQHIFMIGIECGWWQDINGAREYRKEIFHTKTLVPFDVAEGGHIEVLKWLDSHKGSQGGK